MSKLKILKILGLISIVGLQSAALYACESYSEYSIAELKEFREMLSKPDADSLDRLFAFEQMACSDRPTIRNYALKEGLSTITDPLVRNEIMLKAIMQKKRIDVELGTSKNQTDDDKKFIAQHGGIYSNNVSYQSESEGCISFYNTSCSAAYSLFVMGDKVELNYKDVLGEFRLSSGGELVGTLRAGKSAKFTQIPAVIKLF